MPTVLTKEYLAKMAQEAAETAAEPAKAALARVHLDVDTLKAGIAIQDRGGRLTDTRVKRIEAYVERLEKANRALEADLIKRHDGLVKETRAALNGFKSTQRAIEQQGQRNKAMLTKVLSALATTENSGGK